MEHFAKALSRINRATIVPIIALAALLLKQAFHLNMGQEQLNQITDGVLALVTLVGILTNPDVLKGPPPEETPGGGK